METSPKRNLTSNISGPSWATRKTRNSRPPKRIPLRSQEPANRRRAMANNKVAGAEYNRTTSRISLSEPSQVNPWTPGAASIKLATRITPLLSTPATTPAMTALTASTKIARRRRRPVQLFGALLLACLALKTPIGLSPAVGPAGSQQSLNFPSCRRYALARSLRILIESERQRHLQPQSGFVERREQHPVNLLLGEEVGQVQLHQLGVLHRLRGGVTAHEAGFGHSMHGQGAAPVWATSSAYCGEPAGPRRGRQGVGLESSGGEVRHGWSRHPAAAAASRSTLAQDAGRRGGTCRRRVLRRR